MCQRRFLNVFSARGFGKELLGQVSAPVKVRPVKVEVPKGTPDKKEVGTEARGYTKLFGAKKVRFNFLRRISSRRVQRDAHFNPDSEFKLICIARVSDFF
ncbi:hypothetical protein [Mesorhizobium sp. M1163]|uniref:hypothetical protein n=1 Tax=Mesorhizobium sp. M1163 TaxID=2957065 RepID=UPI0033368724